VNRAVIDSTALIYLTHLDLTLKLSQFFDVVLVPRIVEEEVCRKHRFRYRLRSFYGSGVFEKCKTSNEWNRRLLEHDEAIDPGEAEALTQAQEQDIPVFIGDEKAARKIARKMGKKSVGTAAILSKLYIQGLAGDPRQLVRQLRRSNLNCRITDKIVEEALKRAGEPIF